MAAYKSQAAAVEGKMRAMKDTGNTRRKLSLIGIDIITVNSRPPFTLAGGAVIPQTRIYGQMCHVCRPEFICMTHVFAADPGRQFVTVSPRGHAYFFTFFQLVCLTEGRMLGTELGGKGTGEGCALEGAGCGWSNVEWTGRAGRPLDEWVEM